MLPSFTTLLIINLGHKKPNFHRFLTIIRRNESVMKYRPPHTSTNQSTNVRTTCDSPLLPATSRQKLVHSRVLCQASMGLIEDPKYCTYILRNGHIPCLYFCNFHVNFKMFPCPMLILRNSMSCHLIISSSCSSGWF